MYFSSNFLGCFFSILIFLFLLYMLKELWWIIVGVALVSVAIYWGRKIYNLILQNKNVNQTGYNPQVGEVFKICPFCNSKVKVSEITCPYCKRTLN